MSGITLRNWLSLFIMWASNILLFWGSTSWLQFDKVSWLGRFNLDQSDVPRVCGILPLGLSQYPPGVSFSSPCDMFDNLVFATCQAHALESALASLVLQPCCQIMLGLIYVKFDPMFIPNLSRMTVETIYLKQTSNCLQIDTTNSSQCVMFV